MKFDELLEKSDFVVVSCPLNQETKGMFNTAAFSKMKSTSIFINVARGGNTFDLSNELVVSVYNFFEFLKVSSNKRH